MHEFELIEAVKKMQGKAPRARIGIGDDAAWIGSSAKGFVVSTDTIADGIDFLSGRHTPERIGHKALAVNLSDLAAMGAVPSYFLVTLGLPAPMKPAWVLRFYRGMYKTARRFGAECIGGDLSRSSKFFASITVIGTPAGKKPVTRAGAGDGDWIAVTGPLGGSIHKKHLDFLPRVDAGVFLARGSYAKSMIDISDGLIQDLEHLLHASKLGADLYLDQIPVSSDARRAAKRAGEAQRNALSDGEDFELLFTVSAGRRTLLEKAWKKRFPRQPLYWIGRCRKGKSVIKWYNAGKLIKHFQPGKKGYTHF